MGMPITVEIVGAPDTTVHDAVFDWFDAVDRRFSTYRDDSETAAINRGRVPEARYSADMREVMALAEKTRLQTGGYFDVHRPDGGFDPSGIVKGWAIRRAAALIAASGARDYFVDASGDIQSAGVNAEGEPWRVGIRNPFEMDEIVKVVQPRGKGIATSGTYARGQHIYDPHTAGDLDDLVSLTVIGDDVLEADRFATAAFAMGRQGIVFIESMPGLEGYAIGHDRHATFTSGFEAYCTP
jgi:thiamine biosynthesis lipoprotein